MADFTEQLSGATGREEARLYQLFATAEGLCRKQGDMEKIVAGYLVEFDTREMAGTKER